MIRTINNFMTLKKSREFMCARSHFVVCLLLEAYGLPEQNIACRHLAQGKDRRCVDVAGDNIGTKTESKNGDVGGLAWCT